MNLCPGVLPYCPCNSHLFFISLIHCKYDFAFSIHPFFYTFSYHAVSVFFLLYLSFLSSFSSFLYSILDFRIVRAFSSIFF